MTAPVSKSTVVLGVDTGGTFTDFVVYDSRHQPNNPPRLIVHKVLSTPQAPELAILQGIEELGLDQIELPLYIVHGSTVATNAVLEGKGVRTAYITNRGLTDVLTIGRQARKELYNLQPIPVPPPVPRSLCLGTGGRLAANGKVIEPLSANDIVSLQEQIKSLAPDAIAINLLFSFLDDTFERQIEEAMPEDLFVSRSSDILPETKEYERGIVTWLNAAVGPLVGGYLSRLAKAVSQQRSQPTAISVMQSSGGTIEAKLAAKHAVHMLLSGPAGGLAGAKFVAEQAGHNRLLTFDIGGTSTDVAMIDGELQLTSEGSIGGYPVAVPMVDMHTIGAGGGSIAYVDSGGLLQVGPESAGADPGPACYGKGGTRPTVTDANLVLGRIQVDARLAGTMRLDMDAARQAILTLAELLALSIEQTALGIIQIIDEHMARALRVMSVQRGIDPKELTLVSFGGAGGLHVCALADALDMPQALVPIHAGVLSALGMLVAPKLRYLTRSINRPLQDLHEPHLMDVFAELTQQGIQSLQAEGVNDNELTRQVMVDMRYRGQSYCLTLPWQTSQQAGAAFHALHKKRYGHNLELDIELVTARIKLSAPAFPIELQTVLTVDKDKQSKDAKLDSGSTIYQREKLVSQQYIVGPALITEKVATTYIAVNWQCQVDQWGNLNLSRIVRG